MWKGISLDRAITSLNKTQDCETTLTNGYVEFKTRDGIIRVRTYDPNWITIKEKAPTYE